MDLDELKKSMSTLDDVLAQKNSEPINFNTEVCISAQSRIAKQFRRNILNCSVIAVVFIIMCISGIGENAIPVAMKWFFGISIAVAVVIYMFLYRFTKKIQPATSTPMQIMRQVVSLRLYILIAKIFFVTVLAVFDIIFLCYLWEEDKYMFRLIASVVLLEIIVAVIMLPKKIRDFRELTAID